MDATAAYAIYGAGVSTVLGIVKLWETFWKDRLRLTTTYCLTGAEDEPHTITIVNLSGAPVQVSGWRLEWQPDRSHPTNSTIDVTPDEPSMFTIPPKGHHTLCFAAMDKFDWRFETTNHRQLYLTLFLFGRRRPKVLELGGSH